MRRENERKSRRKEGPKEAMHSYTMASERKRTTHIDQSFANYARDFFLSGGSYSWDVDLAFSGARFCSCFRAVHFDVLSLSLSCFRFFFLPFYSNHLKINILFYLICFFFCRCIHDKLN